MKDNIAPTVTCKNITLQLDNLGIGLLAPTQIFNSSIDNCAIETLTVTPNTFNCSDVGVVTVTLTATDYDGNSDDCTAQVTVEDNIAPNAQCHHPVVQLDASGIGTLSLNEVDNNSNDACGITSSSISQTSFNCNDIGTNQVTLNLTDAHGNTSSCTSTVMVEDSIKPMAKCKDYTTTCTGGQVTISTLDIDDGSSDNCNFSLSLDQTVLDCSNSTVTVTLTATDASGNIDNCTSLVTLQSSVGGQSVSINDVSIMEGNWWGFTFYTFEVERTGGTNSMSVDYATADGTATITNNDYIAKSGTLNWSNGGSNFKYLTIQVRKDNTFEPDEIFYVNLSNPSGGTITDGQGEGTILNDDAAPTIINDQSEFDKLSHSEQQIALNQVALFPNPTTKELLLTLPTSWIESGEVKAELYDNAGRKIQLYELEHIQDILDVSELDNGIYQLIFFPKNGRVVSERFVKLD